MALRRCPVGHSADRRSPLLTQEKRAVRSGCMTVRVPALLAQPDHLLYSGGIGVRGGESTCAARADN